MPLSLDVNRGAISIPGYWQQAAGNRLLATDYRLLAQATMLKPGNEETWKPGNLET